MVGVIYYISRTTRRKIGVGVRRDGITHMILPERRDMLIFSAPCVCGSYTHFSTRNRKCALNERYNDAVVKKII